MQYISKTSQDHNKRIVIGQKKHNVKTQRMKKQSMQQWSIKIPIDLQRQNNQNIPFVNNQFDKEEGNDFNEQKEQMIKQNQHLSQLLSEFIREILAEKYHSQALYRVLNCARKQSLSQLWSIQYTNYLSLASHLLQTALSSNITPNNKPTISHQDNQNKDESNLESEMVFNQIKKKKRKIKKTQQSKNQQHNIMVIKAQTIHNEHQLDISRQQIITTLNSMLQQIQQQILRLQNNYLQEMQNIHILPYIEAQNNLIQTQTKSVKRNYTSTNKTVVSVEKYYPLEGLQKQHQISNCNNNNNNLNYVFPTSTFTNRSNTVFPSMSYDYSILVAQQQQFHNQYQLNQQQQQHRSQFTFPLMSMSQGFNQHVSHLHSQYLHPQSVFPHNNGQYIDEKLLSNLSLSMNNNNRAPKRTQDSISKRSNMKTINIQQNINNNNEDDDYVEEIVVEVMKKN